MQASLLGDVHTVAKYQSKLEEYAVEIGDWGYNRYTC